MKNTRKCRICSTLEDLVYVYTREPQAWDGWMYCKEHKPRMEYDKEPKPQRAKVRGHTKAKGRRAKRRDVDIIQHEAPAPDDRAEQVYWGMDMELGRLARGQPAMVRRDSTHKVGDGEKRVGAGRPRTKLPGPTQSVAEETEAELLSKVGYTLPAGAPEQNGG